MRIQSNLCLFDRPSIGRGAPLMRTDRDSRAHALTTPAQSWWGRALRAVSPLWQRTDDKSLRALAALDDDQVANLSEYGQRLRAAARSAEERRRMAPWPQSQHDW
jgi:hypothetical protein